MRRPHRQANLGLKMIVYGLTEVPLTNRLVPQILISKFLNLAIYLASVEAFIVQWSHIMRDLKMYLTVCEKKSCKSIIFAITFLDKIISGVRIITT